MIGHGISLAGYRVHDAGLGRWWQVDPKAEALYGDSPYCAMRNNPITMSDPDGDLPFLAAVGIGAAVGVFSNGLSNVSSGQGFFNGAGTAALWGGIGAAASFGIGSAFGGVGSFGNELGRGLAHGLSSGIQSHLQGGSFAQGLLSGGISSGIGSGIGALNGGVGGQILGGGLGGGIGSAISGENFFFGFNQGVMVSAFNHSLHEGAQSIFGDPPITVYVDPEGIGHAYIKVGNEVYTYGRFNGGDIESLGGLSPTGEGVLIKLSGKDAKAYIAKRGGTAFKVSADFKKVQKHFRDLYSSGKPNPKYGRVIDDYLLVGNSCVTNCVRGLNVGGAGIPKTIITPAALFSYFTDRNLNMLYRD